MNTLRAAASETRSGVSASALLNHRRPEPRDGPIQLALAANPCGEGLLGSPSPSGTTSWSLPEGAGTDPAGPGPNDLPALGEREVSLP